MKTKNPYLLPLILITTLFFLWGFAHNLNPILIPHLKKACEVSDFQSALIDSAFFMAYFLVALPAGFAMKKWGYKNGILLGLCLFALGAFLFIPAANTRLFPFFLLALFIIASGLTFLETAANPYVTILGDPNTATQRLNLSQSFNGLAATLAPAAGGLFILSGTDLSTDATQNMTPEALNELLNLEAAAVKIPYLLIGIIVLAVAVLIYFSKLPEIKEEETPVSKGSGKSIWRHSHLIQGVITQFFYVGAQVCVSSFFIRYAGSAAGMAEKTAAFYLAIALFGFMIGRFVGTFLMQYISPTRLLTVYAVVCMALLAAVVGFGGIFSIYALVGVEFFMSIMFPTIFSLSVKSLGEDTKLGSSLVIMSIVGGALFPLIMGKMSDQAGIQIAYIVPLICFLMVAWFGWRGHIVKQS